ncbi:hypothetical protein CLV51_106105 [Chitinophaga niastensis]|uniref:Uncharacterized protein n=1 Tax=Chitinophaga niastensis TaxID=536980 RepID=A0A2P8HDD5_CHINA|nr:hypothetical protein [Chitinophaga niastensis]PSL44239.1 hypothetical protein CLV51_106105 [Chitinophaga niastensis]
MPVKTTATTGAILLLLVSSLLYAQQPKADCLTVVLSTPGKCSQRILGDLQIIYKIDSCGNAVTCVLLLNTQLAGLCKLTPTNSTYIFDLELGTGRARGLLKMLPLLPDMPGILNGDFSYSVYSNNRSFVFKGLLAAWYVNDISPPCLQKP